MRRKTYVSCQEYDSIPIRARYFDREARWHRGRIFEPVLDRIENLSWTGFSISTITSKVLGFYEPLATAAIGGQNWQDVPGLVGDNKNQEVLYVSNI